MVRFISIAFMAHNLRPRRLSHLPNVQLALGKCVPSYDYIFASSCVHNYLPGSALFVFGVECRSVP